MQSMFSKSIRLCLLFSTINVISAQQSQSCGLLQKKLSKYQIYIKSFVDQSFPGLRLCENFVNNTCCPQFYADQIQNATLMEVDQLFELHSMNFYQSLLGLNDQFIDTYNQLIEHSRNETHELLQRGYHQLYISYRFSVDKFFHNLRNLTSKNLQQDIATYVDHLFENILHISLTLNKNQSISSSYFSCLWQHQPFGSSPNQLVKQLEIHLGKLFELNELFRLSHELVQILSTSVTTDYQCIDSFMQLSYCNLCSGRSELPCLTNCIDIFQSCLVNVTLINDVWQIFLDSIENLSYFHGIEKVLSSIGLSISDAVMNFLNSGGVQNKNIISQCGHLRSRREVLALEQQLDDERNSFLDRRLRSMKQSLQLHRSFWKRFPEDICRSTSISAPLATRCWTGTFLSEDGKSSNQIQYDKPMNLKLQRILKEIREKSTSVGTIRRLTPVVNQTLPSISSSSVNESKIDLINPSKNAELDDYPNDNDFDYSDYAYEDVIDQTTTTSTTTTTSRTTTSTVSSDDASLDDSHTAYYDYGDNEAYSDDEVEEITTTTRKTTSRMLSTTPYRRTSTFIWKDRIPFYHRRTPIVWNIDTANENSLKQKASEDNSAAYLTYSLLLPSCLFLILNRV